MVFQLKVLNSDASLNNFQETGAFKLIKSSDGKLILQIYQTDKRIRYIPQAGAVITVDFMKSDNTTLTVTATYPFADDRSIFQVNLTATNTALIISQNLIAKIVENPGMSQIVSYALLQGGLQMISLTSTC